jgi:hypothetical protein
MIYDGDQAIAQDMLLFGSLCSNKKSGEEQDKK